MNKKFTLGVISGISAITVAFPVIAQLSSAQDTGATVSTETSAPAKNKMFFKHKMDTTTAGIQERIDRDSAFLANIDAMIAIQKTATQTHKDALTAALAITDDTARATAVKAADEAQRTSVQTAMEANPAFKDAMPFGGGMHKMKMRGGHGPMGGELAEKLGMTNDELKSAMEAGKTIEEIAQEKGIELPARPAFGKMMHDEVDAQ